MNQNSRRLLVRYLLPASLTALLLLLVQTLFWRFGVSPLTQEPDSLALFLSVFYCIDVPLLGLIAGLRKLPGFLWGFSLTAFLQLLFLETLAAPFYAIALYFEDVTGVLRGASIFLLVLTVAAFFLGKTLRRRGWGLSMPGEH